MLRAIFSLLLLVLPTFAFELPSNCTQCIVGVAPDWNSSHATLRFYQKIGGQWQISGSAWPARLGRDGLIWGSGLSPNPFGVKTKREGDWRSPAGVFSIGGVWGYESSIKKNPRLFYKKVTPFDLWIEDPASPQYNRNVVLNHLPATSWEKKQQMKLNDPAHALEVFIAHNAPPKAVSGAGSAIFFHIWRGGGSKPTSGCTTMTEAKLRAFISQLDPAANPLYVLLPKAEYEKLRVSWKLP